MSFATPIDLKYIYKFPWLKGGKEVFEKQTEQEEYQDPELYFKDFFEKYFQLYDGKNNNHDLEHRLIEIFIYALDKRETGVEFTEDEFNVILFYVVKTILTALNNRMIDNHVANFYSKLYYDILLKESDIDLEKVANFMGLKTIFLNRHSRKKFKFMIYDYNIEFSSYIHYASLLKDAKRNLINQYIENGNIYIVKQKVCLLLRENIRRAIIPERIGNSKTLLNLLKSIPSLSNIFEAIENKLKLIKIQTTKKYDGNLDKFDDSEKPSYELYPPCIKVILDKANDGENLTHNERLHIAFFFANTNHTIEETVDVFRTVPDFDEKIARYNVEFSRGKGGKGKQYKVFNCGKLKTQQMCVGGEPSNEYADKICYKGVKRKDSPSFQSIKSPLEYIFWKKVYMNREKRDAKRNMNKDDDGRKEKRD